MVTLLTPVDPEAMGRFWSDVGLPRDTVQRWAEGGLDVDSAERTIAAFDAETVRAWMDGGRAGRAPLTIPLIHIRNLLVF